MVRQAITIYLDRAYQSDLPPRVRALLNTLETESDNFYKNPKFLDKNSFTPEQNTYCLRLGTRFFQHSKLLIQTWPKGTKYFFRIDTHDKQIMVPPDHKEYQAICDLCRNNLEVAESIERAWEEAGIPTFSSCLAQEAARKRIDMEGK